MRTDLPAAESERVVLITRRVRLRDYLWFAAALLVLVAAKALEVQAP